MTTDIRFTGYTAHPSDYDAPDGSLAAAINLINEGGSLRPVIPPAVIDASLPVNADIYRHADRWLVYDPELLSLSYRLDDFSSPSTPGILSGVSISSLTSVGNIVIASTPHSLRFIRWNPATKAYSDLGSSLPELDIQFSLSSERVSRTFHPGVSFVEAATANASQSADTTVAADTQTFTATSHTLSPISDEHESLRLSSPVEFTQEFAPGDYTITLGKLSIVEPDALVEIRDQDGAIVLQTLATPEKSILIDYGTFISLPFKLSSTKSSLSVTITLHASSAQSINFFVEIKKPGAVTTTNVHIQRPDFTADNYNRIAGALNTFVAEEITQINRFIHPFFIRYAIRLYDGSIAGVSAPALLKPNVGYSPEIFFNSSSGSKQLLLRAYAASVTYQIKSLSDFAPWQDLISSIDFFVSPPSWPYSQGAEFSDRHPELFSFRSAVAPDTGYEHFTLKLAEKPALDQHNDLIDTSVFRHVCSVPFSEILSANNNNPKQLPLEPHALENIHVRTALDASALSYAGYAGASLHAYNNRLHIFNASVVPSPPVHPLRTHKAAAASSTARRVTIVKVHLRTANGDRVVCRRHNADVIPDRLHWYFYPDSRAFKAEFLTYTLHDQWGWYSESSFSISLTTHPFLSGAYHLSYNNSLQPHTITRVRTLPGIPDVVSQTIPAPSSLYLSEAGNPFVFSASGVVSIPEGSLQAISSAAKALSQGQFGQFPLYAFTDKGVWALEVSATGTYSARQPITRDVCINPKGITQIDSAVLFPSSRGIMLLSGSQAQCISDEINSDAPSPYPSLSHLCNLLGTSLPAIVPFSTFLAECRMLYQYSAQRIILFNPAVPYAYIYSLKSKLWGMMRSSINRALNAWPEAVAVTNDGTLLDFSRESSPDSVDFVLVTRPLKLGTPDDLKTINTVVQHGDFQRGHVQAVLFGSRDLVHWYYIWSSKNHDMRGFSGSPFKYFRIMLIGNLAPRESLSAASVQFIQKYSDKMR